MNWRNEIYLFFLVSILGFLGFIAYISTDIRLNEHYIYLLPITSLLLAIIFPFMISILVKNRKRNLEQLTLLKLREFIQHSKEEIPVAIQNIQSNIGLSTPLCEKIIIELTTKDESSGEYLPHERVFIKTSTTLSAIDELLREYDSTPSKKDKV